MDIARSGMDFCRSAITFGCNRIYSIGIPLGLVLIGADFGGRGVDFGRSGMDLGRDTWIFIELIWISVELAWVLAELAWIFGQDLLDFGGVGIGLD